MAAMKWKVGGIKQDIFYSYFPLFLYISLVRHRCHHRHCPGIFCLYMIYRLPVAALQLLKDRVDKFFQFSPVTRRSPDTGSVLHRGDDNIFVFRIEEEYRLIDRNSLW